MSPGTALISHFAKQSQHSRPQLQPSPQQSTGSVMMDITDTATAAATDDLTLAGYTRAIEQGRHPAWGPQQTSQLNEGTPVKRQQAASPQTAGSRPATSALKAQAWLASEFWHHKQCFWSTAGCLLRWHQHQSAKTYGKSTQPAYHAATLVFELKQCMGTHYVTRFDQLLCTEGRASFCSTLSS